MDLRMKVVGNEVFVEGHLMATINKNAIYSHKEEFKDFLDSYDNPIEDDDYDHY